VNWVFCQVEEIEQSTDRPDESTGYTATSIWNPNVNNDTKQKPADLVVLGAGYTREMGDTFEKEPNIVIRRKAAATGIDFSFAASLL